MTLLDLLVILIVILAGVFVLKLTPLYILIAAILSLIIIKLARREGI